MGFFQLVNRIQNYTTKGNYHPAFSIKTCAWFPTHPISMSMFNYANFILFWIYPNCIQINQNKYLIHRQLPTHQLRPCILVARCVEQDTYHDFILIFVIECFKTNFILILSWFLHIKFGQNQYWSQKTGIIRHRQTLCTSELVTYLAPVFGLFQ